MSGSLRVLAVLLVVAGAAAFVVPTSPGRSRWHCQATPVRGQVVKAGVFSGLITPTYDVVRGRFRLHVGDYRDRALGLSQKIPWFAPTNSGSTFDMTIYWTRLAPLPARRFYVRAQMAGATGRGYAYPTSFSPPDAGCWRLRFQSGTATGTLTALVSGQG